jgi:hypothetical protein
MARPGTERQRKVASNGGSVPTGPSEEYLRLLREEISPEEYAKRVKRRLRKGRKDEPEDAAGHEGNGAA